MLSKAKMSRLGFKAVTAGLVSALAFSAGSIVLLPTAAHAELSGEIQAASQKIDSIADELKGYQQSFDDNEALLQETAQAIETKEQEISDTKDKLQAAKLVLSKRVRSSYKSGPTSLLELVMGSVDMQDLVSRIHYMDSISQEDARTINDVKTLSQELADARAALQTKQDEEKAQSEKLQQKIDEMQQKRKEAQDYYNNLSAEAQKALQEEIQQSGNANSATIVEAIGELNSEAAAANGGGAQAAPAPADSSSNDDSPAPAPSPSRRNSSRSYSDAGGPVANAYQMLNRGYRYQWGSNNPSNGGFDCSGLMQYVFKLSGHSISRTTWTQRDEVKAHGNWKTSVDQLEPGDLIFFNNFNHVGMYVGGGKFIHSSSSRGPICVSLSQYLRWSGPFEGGGSPL